MLAGKQAVAPADYETFIARRENLERRFEQTEGEIVEKMPAQQHGIITLKTRLRRDGLLPVRHPQNTPP